MIVDEMTAPQVGDALPRLSWSSDFAHWNRFAAVNDEFVDIHMSDEAGRAAGFPAAFGMGNLLWSYLHVAVRSWIGPEGEVLALSCRFSRPSARGDKVTATGEVVDVAVDSGEMTVTLTVWVESAKGEVLAPGRATVRLR